MPSSRGGETTAISRTPATCAGTAPMSRLEISGVLPPCPPGTYKPARSTASTFWPRTVPSGRVMNQERSFSAWWNSRICEAASAMTSSSSGVMVAAARSSSCGDTARGASKVGQSKRRVCSITASSPLAATSSRMARVCASTASPGLCLPARRWKNSRAAGSSADCTLSRRQDMAETP